MADNGRLINARASISIDILQLTISCAAHSMMWGMTKFGISIALTISANVTNVAIAAAKRGTRSVCSSS